MNPLTAALDAIQKLLAHDADMTFWKAAQLTMRGLDYLIELFNANPVRKISEVSFAVPPNESLEDLVLRAKALVPVHSTISTDTYATAANVPAWVITLVPIFLEILKKLLNNETH